MHYRNSGAIEIEQTAGTLVVRDKSNLRILVSHEMVPTETCFVLTDEQTAQVLKLNRESGL